MCAVHGGVAPTFFSERLFGQVCDEPTQPATLEEISDVTFKEKLIKVCGRSQSPWASPGDEDTSRPVPVHVSGGHEASKSK